ncbi:MAG: serine/threonine-protein kinase [Marinicella sp.]
MDIDQQTYQTARKWFLMACEQPAGQRKDWLKQQNLDVDLLSLITQWLAQAEHDGLDQLDTHPQIKGYEIRSLIGTGGAGRVYEAKRTGKGFDQLVAIKIIENQHPAVVMRFIQEQQILVTLDHPGIARLIDAGETLQHQPFLVMERVQGVPIDQYCESLNSVAIIQIFVKVLNSVAFAHRHLILHRDLKPANVLVDVHGSPKLLDFGIAKILNESQENKTTKDHQAYTPQFASPEQINGNTLTITTDIYSCGVILYVLLSGHTPYPEGLTHIQLIKRIANDQINWQHSLDKLKAPKDLSAIIRKATRFEPEARYQSINDFQQDLIRWRTGLPVHALQGDWWYSLTKTVRKRWLALLVSFTFIAMLVGFNFSMKQQLAKTQTERDTAESVLQFLENSFAAADPEEHPGIELTVRQVMLEGVKKLAQVDSADVRARIANSLAQVFNQLELYDDALDISSTPAFENQPELISQSVIALLGKNEYQNALDVLKDTSFDLPHKSQLEINALIGLEQYQHASVLIDQALLEQKNVKINEDLIRLRLSKASCLYYLNDYIGAQQYSEQTLKMAEQHLGVNNFTYINALHDAAFFNEQTGKLDLAEQQFIRSIEVERQLRGESTVGVAISLDNLATVQTAMNKLDDALKAREEALEIFSNRNAIETQSHHIVLGNTAHLLEKLNRNTEAISRYREVIKLFQKQPESSQIQLGIAYHNMARALMNTGQMYDARNAFDESKQYLETQLGESHPILGNWWQTNARYYELNDQADEQLKALKQALLIFQSTVGESHPKYIAICQQLTDLNQVCASG